MYRAPVTKPGKRLRDAVIGKSKPTEPTQPKARSSQSAVTPGNAEADRLRSLAAQIDDRAAAAGYLQKAATLEAPDRAREAARLRAIADQIDDRIAKQGYLAKAAELEQPPQPEEPPDDWRPLWMRF